MINGRLWQPTVGTAPFPAVLISHGQNGSAAGFGAPKAAVMRGWGLVCIAPDYTHINLSYAPGTDGWSAENQRRAEACLTILASLGNVDMARVAAYGNSKGAFLTAGLCGATAAGEIRAAAITAGGVSATSDTSFAAPTPAEVAGISAPFLMLHGTADTTVQPVQSANLETLLDGAGVTNARWLWSAVGHNLHAERASDVYALIKAWFSAHGVLGDPGDTPPTLGALRELALPTGTTLGPLALQVADAQSAASALTLTAFSLDVALVPAAGLTLSGTGADRGLRVVPSAGSGTLTLVVSVDDGRLSSVQSFDLELGLRALRPFCGGDGLDPAVTTSCPCANNGAPGHGCAHSVIAAGAQLALDGDPQPDTLLLRATSLPTSAFTLFLQHDASAQTTFHDGVLCAGGTMVRLRGRNAAAGIARFPDTNFANDATTSISQRGGVTPGSGARRYYAAWFRNASTTFCPPATANVSNGWIVDW